VALDAGLGPRPREVLLEVPVHRRGHDHRDDRSERRERHVLLRVPRITLRAQVGGAQVAAERGRGAPLDQLVEHRRRHDDVERQVVAPEAAHVGDAQEDLARRIREEQPVAEVDEPVVVVPLRAGDARERPPVSARDQSSYGTSEYV
jgi:hypothetical protein